MTRRLARRQLTVAVVAAPLVLLPTAASAHVVLEQSEVAAGSVAELHFRAPIEKQGTTNRKIHALVPGPLVVRSCAVPSAAWSCTPDSTSRPGDTFVTWETAVAGSPQDLRFGFTVTIPPDAPARDHKLPVVQTYADGSVSRWIDDGEPSPAPRLAVLARGQAPATRAATAPSHSDGSPSVTSSDPARSSAATTSGPTGTSPAGRPTVTTPPSRRAASPSSGAVVPSTDPLDLVAVQPPATSGGGAPPAVGLVVAALAAAAAGGAVLLVRRRRAA